MLEPCGSAGAEDFEALGAKIDAAMESDFSLGSESCPVTLGSEWISPGLGGVWTLTMADSDGTPGGTRVRFTAGHMTWEGTFEEAEKIFIPIKAAGTSFPGTERDPRSTYFAFADKHGLSLIPWDGGWRVDILDPRLDRLWPQYDAHFHERWKQAGHSGCWVFFYGRTIQQAVSKARSWLHRHPEIMEFKKAVRLKELMKELPKDKCID